MGSILTNLDIYDHIWTHLDQFGPIWTHLDPFGPIWTQNHNHDFILLYRYVFIHEALLEAVCAGSTEIPCRNLHQYIQSLMQTEPGENITSMEMEFKKLSNIASTEPQR